MADVQREDLKVPIIFSFNHFFSNHFSILNRHAFSAVRRVLQEEKVNLERKWSSLNWLKMPSNPCYNMDDTSKFI